MIRLLSVVGHGTNLIEHHIKHYSKYVDEINYVIYNTDERPRLHEEVKEIIEGYDNVKIVKIHYDRIFDWERVTMLYNYITNKEPNDWWVIADIDEFHIYSLDVRQIISECNSNGWELVRGGFVDRIGVNGTMPVINAGENIFKQFPLAGFFRYPLSGACPNKVCIMKGYIELTNGQHYVKIDGHTTWRWQGWDHPLIAPVNRYNVQVHHFKWDNTCIERIKEVVNIKKDYAYSDEYEKMYKELEKSEFKIDVTNPEFMIEDVGRYGLGNWNKLFKKIISI
jgi:superoxide dismutase